MRLQQKLDDYKQSFLANPKVTPEIVEIMERNTEQLRSSGILQHVLKVGDRIPSFDLPNQDNQLISSKSLLESGPVVVSSFRGVW